MVRASSAQTPVEPGRTGGAGAHAADQAERVELDVPTLVAVSAMAWAIADVLHEIVGHAGAAVLFGIPVRAVSTTTAYIDWDEIETATQYRIINGAGAPVNLVTGALALLALHRLTHSSAALRCFLFLFSVFSFTIVAWNAVTLPLLGAGDWGEVAEGLEMRGLWTAVVLAVGIPTAIVGYALPLRWWMPDLSHDPELRRRITLIPIATLIVVQTLSTAASPFATAPAESNHLLASVFAFVHVGLWAILVNRGVGPRSTGPPESNRLPRSVPWLVAGLAVAVFFVAVLGPGLGPLENDPRLL
jgi:hypothetical protein